MFTEACNVLWIRRFSGLAKLQNGKQCPSFYPFNGFSGPRYLGFTLYMFGCIETLESTERLESNGITEKQYIFGGDASMCKELVTVYWNTIL